MQSKSNAAADLPTVDGWCQITLSPNGRAISGDAIEGTQRPPIPYPGQIAA